MNINVHANQKADNTYTNVRQKKGQDAGGKRKNIDGSAIAFNQGTESAIARKRKLAQEKAMRLISRAWDKDKAVAQGLQDKQELIDAKTKKNAERSSQLKDIEMQKQSMQEEYGITADSQEQKDLELLEKCSYDRLSEAGLKSESGGKSNQHRHESGYGIDRGINKFHSG